jgi:hypothetical protein
VRPEAGAPAKVPAMADMYDVLPAFKGEAEEALTKEKYPRKYERDVRRYYESLDAGAPKRSASGATEGGSSE